jgi:hypothetical protein
VVRERVDGEVNPLVWRMLLKSVLGRTEKGSVEGILEEAVDIVEIVTGVPIRWRQFRKEVILFSDVALNEFPVRNSVVLDGGKRPWVEEDSGIVRASGFKGKVQVLYQTGCDQKDVPPLVTALVTELALDRLGEELRYQPTVLRKLISESRLRREEVRRAFVF